MLISGFRPSPASRLHLLNNASIHFAFSISGEDIFKNENLVAYLLSADDTYATSSFIKNLIETKELFWLNFFENKMTFWFFLFKIN